MASHLCTYKILLKMKQNRKNNFSFIFLYFFIYIHLKGESLFLEGGAVAPIAHPQLRWCSQEGKQFRYFSFSKFSFSFSKYYPEFFLKFYLIRFQSMQGCKQPLQSMELQKRKNKWMKYGKLFRIYKKPKEKRCSLTLDFKAI